MRKNILLATFYFIVLGLEAQSGKYAGSMKKIIGIYYTDARQISALKNWQFKEASVVTPLDAPETIVADVFSRGKTWITFFSSKENSDSSSYTIMDVVEITNVLSGWQLKTTFCRQYKIENIEIVALVKWLPKKEFLGPAKKAWRFNRDKRRFEMVSVKGIDCINEGLY